MPYITEEEGLAIYNSISDWRTIAKLGPHSDYEINMLRSWFLGLKTQIENLQEHVDSTEEIPEINEFTNKEKLAHYQMIAFAKGIKVIYDGILKGDILLNVVDGAVFFAPREEVIDSIKLKQMDPDEQEKPKTNRLRRF